MAGRLSCPSGSGEEITLSAYSDAAGLSRRIQRRNNQKQHRNNQNAPCGQTHGALDRRQSIPWGKMRFLCPGAGFAGSAHTRQGDDPPAPRSLGMGSGAAHWDRRQTCTMGKDALSRPRRRGLRAPPTPGRDLRPLHPALLGWTDVRCFGIADKPIPWVKMRFLCSGAGGCGLCPQPAGV